MQDATDTVEIYGESFTVQPLPTCKPDCPNLDAQIRLVYDAAALLQGFMHGEPSFERWLALADLQRRAAELCPCPHCQPTPTATGNPEGKP